MVLAPSLPPPAPLPKFLGLCQVKASIYSAIKDNLPFVLSYFFGAPPTPPSPLLPIFCNHLFFATTLKKYKLCYLKLN